MWQQALVILSLTATAMSLGVLALAIPAARHVGEAEEHQGTTLAAGGSTYLVHILMILHARKISRLRWTRAAFFPLLVLPLVCCGLRALYYRFAKGSVQWRGRTIPLQAPRN